MIWTHFKCCLCENPDYFECHFCYFGTKNNKLCDICTRGRSFQHPHDMKSGGREGEGDKKLKTEEDIIYFIEKGINESKNDEHFHNAAKNGWFKAVQLLIKRNIDTEIALDKSRKTPLHIAIESGHNNIVKFLIDNGADTTASDVKGQTSIHFAAIHEQLDVIKYLLKKGSDINQKTKDGLTAIHHASGYGHLNVLKFLHEKGGDVFASDKNGWTALHHAARNNYLVIIKYLIEIANVNIDSQTLRKETVYDIAMQENHYDIMNYLKVKGAIDHARGKNMHDNQVKTMFDEPIEKLQNLNIWGKIIIVVGGVIVVIICGKVLSPSLLKIFK